MSRETYAHLFRILPIANLYVGPFPSRAAADDWLRRGGFQPEGVRWTHPKLRFWVTVTDGSPDAKTCIEAPEQWNARRWAEGVKPLRVHID